MTHLQCDVEERVQEWVEAAQQGAHGHSRVQVSTCREGTAGSGDSALTTVLKTTRAQQTTKPPGYTYHR